MAIEVGLTTGSEKITLTSDYASYVVSGVTSSGSTFIVDLSTDRWYVLEDSSGEYIAYGATGVSPYDNLPNSYYIQDFVGGVENILNTTAISYGYNSIDNAISYYNSGITAWRDEAIAFNTWRDNTLDLMYDNVYSFTADGITLPSLTAGGFTGQTGYFDVGLGAPSRPLLFS